MYIYVIFIIIYYAFMAACTRSLYSSACYFPPRTTRKKDTSRAIKTTHEHLSMYTYVLIALYYMESPSEPKRFSNTFYNDYSRFDRFKTKFSLYTHRYIVNSFQVYNKIFVWTFLQALTVYYISRNLRKRPRRTL